MMFPFFGTAIGNLFEKPSTEKFPCPEDMGMKGYRGRISFDGTKCVDCGMCIKVCAPMAITREVEEVDGGYNIKREFNLTSCTFCAYCQDFCSTKAIQLTQDYHMVAEDPEDLIVKGETFKKKVLGKLACDVDNCVFCGLCMRNCPEQAITVDRATKTWSVNHDECVKCGLCIEKCPKKVLSFKEAAPEGVLFSDACVYCTLCAKKCPMEAITVDRESKTWTIDRDKCVKCGLCISSCPKKALSMGPVEE